MKLYIDMIVFYIQKAGGITSVWKELITRMLRDRQDVVLILQDCECRNIYFEQIMSYQPAVIYEKSKSLLQSRYCSVRCAVDNNSRFISTYYRAPENKNLRQYTLVHDFTYEYYRKGLARWVHSWQKKKSIKCSDTIICVSNHTKQDLLNFYPWAKDKEIHVIYNGVSEVYKKLNQKISVDELKEINTKYFVYVGSRAFYKRFDFAVDVAQCYGYKLVVIGGGDFTKKERKVLERKLPQSYVHLCGISDEKLNEIYNKAAALVYPSEYEGFGIPILEAQRAGCLVVAKKGSSINEVYGNDKYLLNHNDLQEVGSLFEDFKNEKLNQKIRNDGLRNSERFSWEDTYKKYEALFWGGGQAGAESYPDLHHRYGF